MSNSHDWGDSSYDLENLFKPHDEYKIDNSVCNIIESGFGEVMTLVNVNPTILEECQLCIHVDRVKNMFCDSYFLNFLMIQHVIIMREENMVVEIFMIINYLSLC